MLRRGGLRTKKTWPLSGLPGSNTEEKCQKLDFPSFRGRFRRNTHQPNLIAGSMRTQWALFGVSRATGTQDIDVLGGLVGQFAICFVSTYFCPRIVSISPIWAHLGTDCVLQSKTKVWPYLGLNGPKRDPEGTFPPVQTPTFDGFNTLVLVLVLVWCAFNTHSACAIPHVTKHACRSFERTPEALVPWSGCYLTVPPRAPACGLYTLW